MPRLLKKKKRNFDLSPPRKIEEGNEIISKGGLYYPLWGSLQQKYNPNLKLPLHIDYSPRIKPSTPLTAANAFSI